MASAGGVITKAGAAKGVRKRPTAPPAQHLQALAYANEIRLERAATTRSVRGGVQKASELFAAPAPTHLATMRTEDLLRCIKRLHNNRRRQMMETAGVSPYSTLGKLTSRQRGILEQEVQRWEARPSAAAK